MKSKLLYFIIASNLLCLDINAQGTSCSAAIILCDTNSFTLNSMLANSSGQTPACFLNPTQRDIWYEFTVNQSGLLAWKAMPVPTSIEFDWALWDITAGCPGTEVCCNYHYAGGSSSGFGMQTVMNSGTCNDQSYFGNTYLEYSPPINVTSGQIYAIQISNYSNSTNGFTFQWTASTCNVGCVSSIEKLYTPSEIINIYPNPISGTSTVKINSDILTKNENLTFLLFDLLCQPLMETKIINSEFEIQKGNFKSGLYFYKLIDNGKIITSGKIVVE